jgi:hypothetical protein
MHIKRQLRTALLAALFLTVGPLSAQYTDGSLDGVVTDSQGALVRGASVVVKSVQTGAEIKLTSDASGYFHALHLPAGAYSVTVEAAGFKTFEALNVGVNVDTTSRVTVKLPVGGAQEVVTVSAGAPLIQTEDARLSDVITQKSVTDLPLNGREVYQLISLEPGVTATNAPANSSVPSTSSSLTFNFGFISNGATPRANNFVLDGLPNNNEWLGGTPLITPSVDAIQEFQIQTLNFSAEYGRNDGAIANVITRSGTDALHGTVYDFLRNSALNARNFFDPVGQKAPVVQNLFGIAAGLPLVKGKTFLFANYEGSRRKDGQPGLFIIETPQYRSLVESSRPGSLAAMFYKDFPGPACIAGTSVDAGSIPDASAGPIAAAGPLDGIPDYCQSTSPNTAANNNDQYLIRIDQKLTGKDQLFARWINTKSSADVSRGELYGSNVRGFKAPLNGFFADLATGETHTFSSTLLNEFRFGYSRNNSAITFDVPPQSQTEQALAAANEPNDFGNLYFDDGVTSIGGSVYVPRNFLFNSFSVVDTLTKSIGHQSIKVGFQFRRIQENSNYELVTHPFYEFNSIFNFANDQPYLVEAQVNRNPNSPQFGQFTGTPRHYRWTQPALFVQDDWRLTSKLVVNLGLRWEQYGGPTETNGLLANMIFPSGMNLQQDQIVAQMSQADVGRVSSLWKTRHKDFAPRLGVSWDPFGDGKTVLRGGYSIAYQEPYSNLYSNTRFDPPDAASAYSYPVYGFGTNVNYTFPFQPTSDFKAAVSPHGGIVGTKINPEAVLPTLKTAYSEQYFLGFQHEFASNYALSVNYVGTRGIHNYTREDYNRFDGDVCNPTTCDEVANDLNTDFGQTTFVSNEGYSFYNGANAQLKKNFAHGLSFVVNYTIGKVLDNVTEGGLGDYGNVNDYAGLYAGVEDLDRPRLDYGPSEFDVRHRGTFSGIWEIPGPKEGFKGKLLGGWQLNTIISMQSGRPFDVNCTLAYYDGCDFNMDGLGYDRPNMPAGIQQTGYSKKQFEAGVFGNSTFVAGLPYDKSVAIDKFCPNGLVPFFDGTPCVPIAQDGTMTRNSFRGPDFKDADISFFKNTMIKHKVTTQFRAEGFNLLNRTNLYNPSGDLGAQLFGVSTAAFASRQIQFGLKILY